MSALLDTPIEYLKGVGPQRADLLKKELQIFTSADLISFFPFRYVDRTQFFMCNELNPDMPYAQLRGKLQFISTAGEARKKRLTANFTDGTGAIDLVWFQGIKWIQPNLKKDTEYIVFGKPTLFNNKINIAHPEIQEATAENLKLLTALQPVYNSSEKLKQKGLDAKGIWKLQIALAKQLNEPLHETISEKIIAQYNLLSRNEAYRQIHLPHNQDLLTKAELRLKFEELFFIQLHLLKVKSIRQKNYRGYSFDMVGSVFNEFYNHHLPYTLTNAQKRVIKEIRNDMGSGKQMNRLLQGDVGSGKTLVALMSMLIAADNDFQSCIMAPTEILATQHYNTLCDLLKNMQINICLLTGSTKQSARKNIHRQLQSGEMNIIIGTHALLEEEVKFNNLGLVVIDEQHRFGVEQRSKLWKKNTNPPHVLVMTATPIPRTLAMTLYGDLDISVIDEMPPGRKPIKTIHYFEPKRLAMIGFIREQIKIGRQVYIVYPLIEESEKLDLANLQEGYESLLQVFPRPQYQIGVLHGKMKADAKEFEMQRFVKGQTTILVATTVIEVGVNVPNASVMVIENAERFGLSQLHQLRGRVGRGAEQSYCLLMSSYKLGDDAKTRLSTMCNTNDGFKIAEVDLRLRGAGDIAGTQQSGQVDLKISNLVKDQKILLAARNCAIDLLADDEDLAKPENQKIASHYNYLHNNKPNWIRIS
jgi:ATP-dependent DNA helicase RecG